MGSIGLAMILFHLSLMAGLGPIDDGYIDPYLLEKQEVVLLWSEARLSYAELIESGYTHPLFISGKNISNAFNSMIEPNLLTLIEANRWDLINELIGSHVVAVNYRFSSGETFLHHAVKNRDAGQVWHLFDEQIDATIEDNFGYNARSYNWVSNDPLINWPFLLYELHEKIRVKEESEPSENS